MTKTITYSPGILGHVLTIAIIAIRAFQPNAQPLADWSVLSWFYMLLPVTWPFLLFILFYIVKGVVLLLAPKSRTI